jgi:hypothetical protein
MTAPRAGPRTLTFDTLGYRFVVVTESGTAAASLRRLYGGEVTGAHPGALPVFTLRAGDDGTARGWRLQAPGSPPEAHPSLSGALRHLDYEVCYRVMARRTDLLWLHGALLHTVDGSVLISGPSEAGKSTLTLGLMALGYPVGGDDVAVVEPVSGLLRAFPRFLHADRHSRRLLRRAGCWPQPAGRRAGALLPSQPGAIVGPPRVILLKEPPTAAPPLLTPVLQAEAVVCLLQRVQTAGLSHATVIAALQRLVAGAVCYRVSGGGGSGHLPALIAAVAAVLGPPRRAHNVGTAA